MMDEQYYLNKLLNFILLLFLYMAYDMIWNMEGKDFYGDGTYSSKIKMEASEVSFEQKNEAFLS